LTKLKKVSSNSRCILH